MENIYDELKPVIHEKKIAQTLRDSSATPILNVGCGNGELVIFLAFEMNRVLKSGGKRIIVDVIFIRAYHASPFSTVSHMIFEDPFTVFMSKLNFRAKFFTVSACVRN